MTHLPSLKFDFIGDRVEAIVVCRRIVVMEDVKCLVLDLNLTAPRTQDGRTFLECAWWLRPGSQSLGELNRVLKGSGAREGSPYPGDWVAVELAGTRPPKQANRSPLKLFIVEFHAGGPEEVVVLVEEPF